MNKQPQAMCACGKPIPPDPAWENAIEFLRESNNIEDVWDDNSLMQAFLAWAYVIEQKELTPEVILKTHNILMKYHLPTDKGKFRKEPIWIGGREGKPWFVIPELIDSWCTQVKLTINQSKSLSHEMTKEFCQKDHVDYEKIHPFIDGNGRTGRIFMNWQRVRIGLPILVIKNKEKYSYYKWFE